MWFQILALANKLVDLISVHLNFSVFLVDIDVGAKVTVSIDGSLYTFFGIVLIFDALKPSPMRLQLGLNVINGDGI